MKVASPIPRSKQGRELAIALNLHPLAFLALVHAASEQKTAAEILDQVYEDLKRMEMLDSPLPQTPATKAHPRTQAAKENC